MKKSLLTGLLQYIGAVVLVLCSALTVYAFDAGKLPFMDADYLEARKQGQQSAPVPETEKEEVKEETETQVVTAATYVASLPKADESTVPYVGVYGADNNLFVLRPVSALGTLGTAKLQASCGFVVKSENEKIVSVYDNKLNDVTSVINGWTLTYLRNAEGKVLFVKDGAHAYLENGALVSCDFDGVNLDKGVYLEYPSYYAGYNTQYTVFSEANLYGMKRADGTVVVEAKFADVYGVSEGFFIAVDGDKRLHLYKEDGTLVSNEYYASENDGVNAVGYYFVRHGLTRARTADGVEVMLRTDGTLLSVPSGFSVCAYSDGAVLLKNGTDYGYMSYNGRWISTPDYKQAAPFSEGLAAVCDANGNYGMIDLQGNTVIPLVFTSISNSSDGVIVAYAQKYGYYIINKV